MGHGIKMVCAIRRRIACIFIPVQCFAFINPLISKYHPYVCNWLSSSSVMASEGFQRTVVSKQHQKDWDTAERDKVMKKFKGRTIHHVGMGIISYKKEIMRSSIYCFQEALLGWQLPKCSLLACTSEMRHHFEPVLWVVAVSCCRNVVFQQRQES